MTEPSVAIVAARAHPFTGGVETHVAETSRRLATAGVPVTLLTTDPAGTLPSSECRDGVTVRRFRARPRNGDLYFSPALARSLSGSLARAEVDVVHVQGVHTLVAPLALRVAERAGVPTVLTFHTGGHSSAARRAVRFAHWRAIRPLLRRAAALVAVCEHEVDLFARVAGIPPAHFRLIRNGTEPLPVAAGGSPFAGDPLVVSVGRLERYKGHQRLVAAMPALLAAAGGARLVIVGAGPYEETLRGKVRALGLDGSVAFTSFPSDRRADLGALVQRADVVALMSDYEAHPVSVMEALGLGRPVVVAATSGLLELARDGLVTAVAPDAGADVLARALLAAADGATGPSGVPPGLPSWDDCASELLDLYREVTH